MSTDTEKRELNQEEMLDEVIRQALLAVRTIMVAECVSFNEERNTVSVQPLIQTKKNGETISKNLPVIQDVPIAYYGAGGVVMTYKPVKGDVCELHISDRSLEQWKKKGGVTDPQRSRHHNMTDAIAYFGLNEYENAYGSLRGGMDIRTRDGNTSINLVDGVVEVEIESTPIMTLTNSQATFTVPIQAPSATLDTTLEAGASVSAPNVEGTSSLKVSGTEMDNHVHGGVTRGTQSTDPV